ncbi:hypothetical protein KCP73_24155 [Salmonella enterica subsp. enterica]|nr:hypothetical protein KCP73_24155 [Salmonella enterica subsp. enterica]
MPTRSRHSKQTAIKPKDGSRIAKDGVNTCAGFRMKDASTPAAVWRCFTPFCGVFLILNARGSLKEGPRGVLFNRRRLINKLPVSWDQMRGCRIFRS